MEVFDNVPHGLESSTKRDELWHVRCVVGVKRNEAASSSSEPQAIPLREHTATLLFPSENGSFFFLKLSISTHHHRLSRYFVELLYLATSKRSRLGSMKALHRRRRVPGPSGLFGRRNINSS